MEKRAKRVHCMLGFPLDMVSMDDVLTEIFEAARTRRRLFISTVNLNFLTQSQVNQDFKNSLHCSNLCVADGIAVKLIGMLLGIPVPERVAGSDILEAICERPSNPQTQPLKVFFFGGTEQAGQLACDAINQHPSEKLLCVGSLYPGFGSIEDMSSKAILEIINDADPDFLIVALGAEKGQEWIMKNMGELEVPVISHLGATINFLAGTLKRAPVFWQRIGLEWLWRITQEPRLALRYGRDGLALLTFVLARVLPLSLWLRWQQMWHQQRNFLLTQQSNDPGHMEVGLTGVLCKDRNSEFMAKLCQQDLTRKKLSLNCKGLTWTDTAGMGSLILLSEYLETSGGSLKVAGLNTNLRWAFKINCMQDLLIQSK